jgi:hypothetical protein
MKIKTYICLFLSLTFTVNICFAQAEPEQNSENAIIIEDNSKIEANFSEINEDDTYQAQGNILEEEKRGQVSKPSKTASAVKKKDSSRGEPVTANEVQSLYKKFITSPKLIKILSTIKYAWFKFKKMFFNLPGIKHYRKSKYSGDNYKKEMNKMGDEYNPHLQKSSKGVKMVKQGLK